MLEAEDVYCFFYFFVHDEVQEMLRIFLFFASF
jgi:hypothetical protein